LKSTEAVEFFRKGSENLAFCTTHSGNFADSTPPDAVGLNASALDAVPVRPKEPAILGDDPYHTEVASFTSTSTETGLVRKSTNVLDSLDLGDIEEPIRLPRPKRLQIDHP
jgi:hypothetical protein